MSTNSVATGENYEGNNLHLVTLTKEQLDRVISIRELVREDVTIWQRRLREMRDADLPAAFKLSAAFAEDIKRMEAFIFMLQQHVLVLNHIIKD